jgi:hypothetical protein
MKMWPSAPNDITTKTATTARLNSERLLIPATAMMNTPA